MAEQPGAEWLKQKWWYYSTVGEAYFGLQKYELATQWLVHSRPPDLQVPEWEYESTARQLASLARLHTDIDIAAPAFSRTAGWAVLQEFLGNDATAVRSAFIGKIGLALSGGGFRACLFHIGVLARLAELDLLRHVEVVSCVSGGSVIGTHYYLELRRLLQSKPDRKIQREDYIEIAQRLERDFLDGVQRNIRTRVTASLLTNLKVLLLPNYSRALRHGELFEREIFSRVKDGQGDRPRWLSDLTVIPEDEPPEFNPQYDNWRRAAKVPIFIINATTLNTGHNWQFTATWMGESPANISTEVDSNDRLRRMYYSDAPLEYRRVRLGDAVAASVSLPGLMEPLAFSGLYPERVVKLIDGSFRDGQGTLALLEQDCNVILASDATGHVSSEDPVPSDSLQTVARGVGLLAASLREAKYQELEARRRAGLMRSLMYVHLRKDIGANTVDWIGCPDDPAGEAVRTLGEFTSYGILRTVQQRLAGIRADFDSYTDAEAYALMTSGYFMTTEQFSKSVSLPKQQFPTINWRFLEIEPVLSRKLGTEGAHQDLLKLFHAARKFQFKAWELLPSLRGLAAIVVVAIVTGLISVAGSGRALSSESVVEGAKVFAVVLSAGAVSTLVSTVFSRRTLFDFAVNVFMLTIGFTAACCRLLVTDRLYLHRGSLERLLRKSKTSREG